MITTYVRTENRIVSTGTILSHFRRETWLAANLLDFLEWIVCVWCLDILESILYLPNNCINAYWWMVLMKGFSSYISVYIHTLFEQPNIGCFLQIPANELNFQFRFSHKRSYIDFTIDVQCDCSYARNTHVISNSFNSKNSFFSPSEQAFV